MTVKRALRSLLILMPIAGWPQGAWADDARPVVVELFTSQGCSSCPPADALVNRMSSDASVLPLSYHVNYWDHLGWQDPYSSQENTERQRAYVKLVHGVTMYTPQIMVDGAYSVIGSNESKVRDAMDEARKDAFDVPIIIAPNKAGDTFRVHVMGNDRNGKTLPADGTVWQIIFSRGAKTKVAAGENEGRTLESVHNVLQIVQLGVWQRDERVYRLTLKGEDSEGMAILLQEKRNGRILGAASYIKKP